MFAISELFFPILQNLQMYYYYTMIYNYNRYNIGISHYKFRELFFLCELNMKNGVYKCKVDTTVFNVERK